MIGIDEFLLRACDKVDEVDEDLIKYAMSLGPRRRIIKIAIAQVNNKDIAFRLSGMIKKWYIYNSKYKVYTDICPYCVKLADFTDLMINGHHDKFAIDINSIAKDEKFCYRMLRAIGRYGNRVSLQAYVGDLFTNETRGDRTYVVLDLIGRSASEADNIDIMEYLIESICAPSFNLTIKSEEMLSLIKSSDQINNFHVEVLRGGNYRLIDKYLSQIDRFLLGEDLRGIPPMAMLMEIDRLQKLGYVDPFLDITIDDQYIDIFLYNFLRQIGLKKPSDLRNIFGDLSYIDMNLLPYARDDLSV